MIRLTAILLVLAALPVAAADRPAVDLVLCLDTSNSMRPVIDDARFELWRIVHRLSAREPLPDLRIALVSYGNNTYQPETGWVRLDAPLTRDLDFVAERLFDLDTSGGTEYVARGVETAFDRLRWHDDDETTRMIVVAGNESAEQDPLIPLQHVIDRAVDRDVRILTVYSGQDEEHVLQAWRELAEITGGTFSTLTGGLRLPEVSESMRKLARLSGQLSLTYLPYGDKADERRKRQWEQDESSYRMSPAAAALRAASKASDLYSCDWDLIDAIDQGRVRLEEIAEEDLPERLRGKTPSERQAVVDRLRSARRQTKLEIRELFAKTEIGGPEILADAVDRAIDD